MAQVSWGIEIRRPILNEVDLILNEVVFILATKNNELFCRVQARTPLKCPVSYLLGEPAEISDISFITNSF